MLKEYHDIREEVSLFERTMSSMFVFCLTFPAAIVNCGVVWGRKQVEKVKTCCGKCCHSES